jgi:hypothetical protein
VLDKIKEARKNMCILNLFDFEFYNLDELEYQIQYKTYTLEEWTDKRIKNIK